MVGKVLHAGTGPLNMVVVVADRSTCGHGRQLRAASAGIRKRAARYRLVPECKG